MQTTARITPAESQADGPELLRRFVAGDGAAFDRIVAIYSPRVAGLAFRLLGWSGDLDDVVQDAFLAVFEQAKKFRGGSSLWTWITGITLNRCRVHWRRRRLRRLLMLRPVMTESARAADGKAIEDETSLAVRAAVAELPSRLREVVVLYYLEELPVAEISAAVGASVGAVEVRLHRARQKLRLVLARLIEEQKK